MTTIAEFHPQEDRLPSVAVERDDETASAFLVLTHYAGPFEYALTMSAEQAASLAGLLDLAIAHARQVEHDVAAQQQTFIEVTV